MRVIKIFFDIYCVEFVFWIIIVLGIGGCILFEDKGFFLFVIVIIFVDI